MRACVCVCVCAGLFPTTEVNLVTACKGDVVVVVVVVVVCVWCVCGRVGVWVCGCVVGGGGDARSFCRLSFHDSDGAAGFNHLLQCYSGEARNDHSVW